MFRIWLAAAVVLWAGAASATSELKFGPPSAWVIQAPAPAPATPDGEAVRMLLRDQQTRLGPDGEESYAETVFQIQTPQGLAALGTVGVPWNPDNTAVTIHKLHIIRGGQVIDVLTHGQTFTVLRRENNLERAMLDGVLTAVIQPDGLQVGDLLDFAFTIRRRDPVLQGHFSGVIGLASPMPQEHMRSRVIWPDGSAMRWRETPGSPPAKITRTALGQELDVEATALQPVRAPKGAPRRYAELGQLEVSDFASWAQVSALMAPLFQTAETLKPDSPLRAEAAKIGALSRDPKVRAAAALRLVEDKVRYLALAMNEGGLVPASADETWTRLFGDCKGKTVLLIALLRELGIDAEPVLVSTAHGDGLDARLPMVALFDHVLVRTVIDGHVYWLDGTRLGDRSLSQLPTPAYGWALPLRATGGALERLSPPPLSDPTPLTAIRIDASAGLDVPAPVHVEIAFRGDDALKTKLTLEQVAPANMEAFEKAFWREQYSWFDAKTFKDDYDAATGEERLSMDGTTNMSWSGTTGQANRQYEADGAKLGFSPDLDRESALDQDAPFALAYPYFTRTLETIVLPHDGQGFTVVGGDIDKTLGGYEFKRKAAIAGGVFSMQASARSLVAEIPAARERADADALKALAKTTVDVQAPANYALTIDEAAKAFEGKPATAAILDVRGAQAALHGDFNLALADYEAALRLEPKNVIALTGRALARAQTGDPAGELADADTALRLDPKQSLAYDLRGDVELKRGQVDKAVADYSRAIELAPHDVDALRQRAIAFARLHQFDKAAADADQLGRDHPNTSDAFVARAAIKEAQGLNDQAVAELDKAIAAHPRDVQVLETRARFLAYLGRKAEAAKDWDAILAIRPSVEAYLNRADLEDPQDRNGRAKAAALVERALQLDPKSAAAHVVRGNVYLIDGDKPSALKQYDLALGLAPKDVAALMNRSHLYQETGQFDLARADLDVVIAAYPTDDMAFNARCWLKATSGRDLTGALADCDQALKLRPNVAAYLDSRGLVQLRLGHYAQSIADYGAALATRPKQPESLFGRGLARLRVGDKAGGEADLAAARALDPKIDFEFTGYGLRP